jgi:opacity protein-like surface antigen
MCIRFAAILAASAFAALTSDAAQAGELFLSADLGISGGFASSGGSTDFFDNTGSDSDSSPTYGLGFGLQAPMNEPLPEDWQHRIPSWPVMIDLEFTGGRDYEFLTDGADPYRSQVTSWTVLNNARLDLPLYAPLEWAFGRLPILEPMSFYTTVGLGMTINDIDVTDNVSHGSDKSVGFAWQAGAGIAYEISERVSISVGYRYVDLGEVDLDLSVGPTDFGNFTLDTTAHELATALRVRFFPVSLASSRGR